MSIVNNNSRKTNVPVMDYSKLIQKSKKQTTSSPVLLSPVPTSPNSARSVSPDHHQQHKEQDQEQNQQQHHHKQEPKQLKQELQYQSSNLPLINSSKNEGAVVGSKLMQETEPIVLAVNNSVVPNIGLIEKDGSLPAYPDLVQKLSTFLDYQKQTNQINARMNAFNGMISLFNYVKNRNLQKWLVHGKEQMMLLQGKLRDQRNTILNLHSSIHGMQEELMTQKNTSQNLRKSLDITQQELRDTMEKYRVELAYHHELLKRQQEALKLLYRSKFRNDFLLDCAILLGSTWFCASPIIDYPLKITVKSIIGLFSGGKSASKGVSRLIDFLYSIARIVLIWQSYQGVRGQALKLGVHNGLGSWLPYVNNWILQKSDDNNFSIGFQSTMNDSIQEK